SIKDAEFKDYVETTKANQNAMNQEGFFNLLSDIAGNLTISTLRDLSEKPGVKWGGQKIIESKIEELAQRRDLENNQNYKGEISNAKDKLQGQLVSAVESLQKILGSDQSRSSNLYRKLKGDAKKLADDILLTTPDRLELKFAEKSAERSFLEIEKPSDFAEIFNSVVTKDFIPEKTSGEKSDYAQAKILAAKEKSANNYFKDLTPQQRAEKMYEYLEKSRITDQKDHASQAKAYGMIAASLVDHNDEAQMKAVVIALLPSYVHESQKEDKSKDETMGASFSGAQLFVTDGQGNVPLAVGSGHLLSRIIEDKDFAQAYFKAQDKFVEGTKYDFDGQQVVITSGDQKMYVEFEKHANKVVVTEEEKKLRQEFYRQTVKAQRLMIADYKTMVGSELSQGYKDQAEKVKQAYLDMAREFAVVHHFTASRNLNPLENTLLFKDQYRKDRTDTYQTYKEQQEKKAQEIVSRYQRMYSAAQPSSESELKQKVFQKQEIRDIKRLSDRSKMATGQDHGWSVFKGLSYLKSQQDILSKKELFSIQEGLQKIASSNPYNGVRVADALLPLLQRVVFNKVEQEANKELEQIAWQGNKAAFKLQKSPIRAVKNNTLENKERTDESGRPVKVTAQADEENGKPIMSADAYSNLRFEDDVSLNSTGEYNIGKGRHEPTHQIITQIQEHYKGRMEDYIALGTDLGKSIQRLADIQKVNVNQLDLTRKEMGDQEKAVIEDSADKGARAALENDFFRKEENSGLLGQIAQSLSYLTDEEKKDLKGANIYEKYLNLTPEQKTKVSHLWVEKNRKEEGDKHSIIVKRKIHDLAKTVEGQMSSERSSKETKGFAYVAMSYLNQAYEAVEDENVDLAEDLISKATVLANNDDPQGVANVLEDFLKNHDQQFDQQLEDRRKNFVVEDHFEASDSDAKDVLAYFKEKDIPVAVTGGALVAMAQKQKTSDVDVVIMLSQEEADHLNQWNKESLISGGKPLQLLPSINNKIEKFRSALRAGNKTDNSEEYFLGDTKIDLVGFMSPDGLWYSNSGFIPLGETPSIHQVALTTDSRYIHSKNARSDLENRVIRLDIDLDSLGMGSMVRSLAENLSRGWTLASETENLFQNAVKSKRIQRELGTIRQGDTLDLDLSKEDDFYLSKDVEAKYTQPIAHLAYHLSRAYKKVSDKDALTAELQKYGLQDPLEKLIGKTLDQLSKEAKVLSTSSAVTTMSMSQAPETPKAPKEPKAMKTSSSKTPRAGSPVG
ncbi:MAG TPA: hypothetical protein PKO44_08255, partial [Candidatus Omnitrophota bacterium]|nr:hypothetical protein [Candidatus Omnitrophota bacterium]